MNIKSEQIRQVLVLLGSPEMVNSSHEMAIRTFISEYPYIQPAYYLLAKSTLHQDTHTDHKSLAATYCPNGEILYRTIFQPYKFTKNNYQAFFKTLKQDFENNNSPWTIFKRLSERISTEEQIGTPIENEVVNSGDSQETTISSEEIIWKKYLLEEKIEIPITSSVNISETELTETSKNEVNPIVPIVEIETFDHPDSVYNSIFNDIRFENSFSNEKKNTSESDLNILPNIEENETYISNPTSKENLINSQSIDIITSTNPEVRISKYDDDAMPYSFLWWLQKTRKDYYKTYQPFSKNVVETSNTALEAASNIPEKNLKLLENQYKEHIFNLQTPFNIEDHLAERIIEPKKPKSSDIIDRFIKNEPQISAPVPNKLDNENKARISTDESSELVTETLAKIYVEQMLYHKAIATYQKLSLKFPEKNRYFADLISQLEQKIN